MIDSATELTQSEIRLVRRLSRLFRCQYSGRLRRRSADAARRLIERRGRLIDELMRMEAKRRSFAQGGHDELDGAMTSLAREVELGKGRCLEVLAELETELTWRRGAGRASGLRDGAAGELLGRG